VLTVLWIGLGVWQVERLQWKEGLIAEVNARLTAQAYDLPPVAEWSATDTSTFEYHPVTLSGQYAADTPVLVFTSLTEPKGKYAGAGYWIMTPFTPDGGGTVFVNRGFVPQDSAPAFLDEKTVPKGHMSLTGTMLPAEAPGPFTPAPDRTNHIDWIANAPRLAAFDGIAGPVFPLTLDLPAGPAGALPQGGETTVDFANNHLGYALTWFGLALLTPGLLAYWIWRQLRPKSLPQ
jgi:surfeit locus 1 family protein